MSPSWPRSLWLALTSVALLVLLHSTHIAPHSAEEWKTRSIYQIITDRFALPPPNSSTAPCPNMHDYCGGTWTGITAHLDYITAMGFNAIWISPVPKNVPHSYHGYAANDLWQLNEHYGTEDDFRAMIAACHERDVWLMLDVVGNHMAAVRGDDFSGLQPFNESEYYHDCSICDQYCSIPPTAWDPPNGSVIEHCRLDGLADLDQDHPYVRRTLLDWIDQMVRNYSIDGLRIDTVPEVKPAFWYEWQQRAGVYAFGEVFNSNISYVAQYQQVLNATLSYPLFFTMRSVFTRQANITALVESFRQYSAAFPDPTVLGTFLDNHDNPRFLSLAGADNDSSLYLNGLTYTLTSRGIPITYYGTEQGFHGGNDPFDREPLWTTAYRNASLYYPYIVKLNAWRADQAPWEAEQHWVYSGGQEVAFVRGDSLVVLTQRGLDGGSVQLVIKVAGLLDGELASLWDHSDRILVRQGAVAVELDDGLPKVYVRMSRSVDSA